MYSSRIKHSAIRSAGEVHTLPEQWPNASGIGGLLNPQPSAMPQD
jgi:hypothetical protein